MFTLNIAACHVSRPIMEGESTNFLLLPDICWSDMAIAVCSNSFIPHFLTLNRAKYGALAALKNILLNYVYCANKTNYLLKIYVLMWIKLQAYCRDLIN